MTDKERQNAQLEDLQTQSNRQAAFNKIFSTEEGKEVLAHISEMASLHLAFGEGNIERKEGRRELALEIIYLAGKSPSKILQESVKRINRIKGHVA